MAIRSIYLETEKIVDYSPVESSGHALANHLRDCMRNPGHGDRAIPWSKVDARRLDALIYREYIDPAYPVPKPDQHGRWRAAGEGILNGRCRAHRGRRGRPASASCPPRSPLIAHARSRCRTGI